MFFCFYAYDMENLIISEMQFLVDDETYRLKHQIVIGKIIEWNDKKDSMFTIRIFCGKHGIFFI